MSKLTKDDFNKRKHNAELLNTIKSRCFRNNLLALLRAEGIPSSRHTQFQAYVRQKGRLTEDEEIQVASIIKKYTGIHVPAPKSSIEVHSEIQPDNLNNDEDYDQVLMYIKLLKHAIAKRHSVCDASITISFTVEGL